MVGGEGKKSKKKRRGGEGTLREENGEQKTLKGREQGRERRLQGPELGEGCAGETEAQGEELEWESLFLLSALHLFSLPVLFWFFERGSHAAVQAGLEDTR